IVITFSEATIITPPPPTAPTITGVNPNTGQPSIGTTVTITGTNFRSPVRVIVDAGPAGVKEAFVDQGTVTLTSFRATIQPITLATSQSQTANITVVVDAGNPSEARGTQSAAVTFVSTPRTP